MEQPQEIELDGSVDPHFHGRNSGPKDGRMKLVLAAAAREHEALVLIGNTVPSILTAKDADAYLAEAASALPRGATTELYVAPLLTNETTPEMIYEMRLNKRIAFIKGFLEGVSNDGGKNVRDVRAIMPTLRACHDSTINARALPVHWHMERKFAWNGARIAMRNREWYAVKHDLAQVLALDPEGSHTVKHVSDVRTLVWLRRQRRRGFRVWAEIAPHYLTRCHEDLYEGAGGKGTAFNTHDLCWPIYKSAESRVALLEAALSGDPWVFFGSDCACHVDDPSRENGVKITSDGVACGGAAILPALSKAIVIDHFVRRGKQHLLNGFFSKNVRIALGLPQARSRMRYVREDVVVPDLFPGSEAEGSVKIRPFMRGETYHWVQKD